MLLQNKMLLFLWKNNTGFYFSWVENDAPHKRDGTDTASTFYIVRVSACVQKVGSLALIFYFILFVYYIFIQPLLLNK